MMEELPLSQHVPHASSVPTCNWYNEKSAICSPSDPQSSVPICKVNGTLVWSWPENRPNKNPFIKILQLCSTSITLLFCPHNMKDWLNYHAKKKASGNREKLMLWKNYINEEDGALLSVKLHLENKKRILLNIPRNIWQMQCQKPSLLFPPWMLWIFIALKTIQ